MSVRILEDVVIDRIAAGEVVERPASVLKELLENALDAGATRVDIDLKAGGVALIAVTDDGVGMSRADATLAIERHATSKITRADDLVGVVTYGFRGEAVPSIASVSRFELTTRQRDDELATRIRIDGGKLVSIDAVVANPGTTVRVRSLFHHVPARRKFLRSTQTELAHCLEAVKRALMHRGDVAVVVRHEGREVLSAASTDELGTRVRDLVGDEARVLVPVAGELRGVRVQGLVSPLGVHRSSATGSIYLYVHGRFVSDKVLRRAITQAYRGVLPSGRHPIVVLDVRVPPESVDVNVHPAKTEVRFTDPDRVSRVVADRVRDALRGEGAVRVATEPSRPEVPVRASHLPLLDGVPEVVPSPSIPAHPDEDPRLRQRPAEVVPVLAEPEVQAGPAEPIELGQPSVPAGVEPAPEPEPVHAAEPAAEHEARRRLRDVELIEVSQGIAVGRHPSGLVLIDLVAVQRRWVAHRLRAGHARSRPLLTPVVVELARADASRLMGLLDTLSDAGLEVRGFSPGAVAVVTLPDLVDSADVAALVHRLARGADVVEALADHAVGPPVERSAAAGLMLALDEAGLGWLETALARSLTPESVRSWLKESSR